ncbi:MAG TPA: serine hydrolase domain-containing protein [Jatrophihabitans sp.]|uniref:serine hydrolase domain-containing protein n=1 Tax=Jatrophihabitans sp. TaxID=1932789 RepID=UPI002F1E1B91
MSDELQDKLDGLVCELGVIGVAAGVLVDGQERYAFSGVTSVENPLPVEANTLFQVGSTTKTFTATALLRLVDQGLVGLDDPVRSYVPEFRTKQPEVGEQVTVLHLLNHTAGWDGDLFADTGNGDDSLARYVELMADLEQVTPLGGPVSYNNASLSLAGRVIEKVSGATYEQALRELLLTPLGLENTWFFPADVMTRRFAVGHTCREDGRVTVNRPWAVPRSAAPAGGLSANAADQLAWARFHLGDGTAPDGARLLPATLLRRMQEPTVDMRGSTHGDYVGLSWLLRDIGGTRLVGHGGSTNGQYSNFTMAPQRGFALISMTNSGPNGPQLNDELTKWALRHYLELEDVRPEPLVVGDDELAVFAGEYHTIAVVAAVTVEQGRLVVVGRPKAGVAEITGGGEEEDAQRKTPLALVAGEGDPFVVCDGPAKGMRGYFTRDARGAVDGFHFGGRLATRAEPASEPA